MEEMVAKASALSVVDDETNHRAVGLAGEAKRVFKAIEAKRKELVKEPNRYVRAVNAFAKQFTEKLKQVETSLKRKVADYQYRLELERRKREAEEKRKREELQRKMEAEAKEAGVEPVKLPDPVVPERPKVTRTETGSAHLRMEWTFEIKDETKLPREYLIPDMKKIRAAVKAGVRTIPGVKIFERPTTVIK